MRANCVATLAFIPHVAALLLQSLQNVVWALDGAKLDKGIVAQTELRMIGREYIDVKLVAMTVSIAHAAGAPFLVGVEWTTVYNRGVKRDNRQLGSIGVRPGCLNLVALPATPRRTTHCPLGITGGTMTIRARLTVVRDLHGLRHCDGGPTGRVEKHVQRTTAAATLTSTEIRRAGIKPDIARTAGTTHNECNCQCTDSPC